MPRTVTSSASVSGSLATTVAALLLAGACSSSSPSGTPGAAGTSGAAGTRGGAGTSGVAGTSGGTAGIGRLGPPTSLWTLTPAASPATVAFTAETSSKVVKDVPLAGATLTTVASDGTTFELTVPGDALFSPATIAMTPVLITSQPFSDEPAWGVQLLPDGLAFNKPVTLVITPAGAASPVNQQVPFGWSGTNNAAFLAYPDAQDAHLVLKLLHFSSYAYATARQGMSSSLAGVRNRLGGSAESRIESAAAELLSAKRQKALLGSSEDNLINDAELQKLRDEYQKEVVDVRVAAAGDSCAAGRLALLTVLGSERSKELLGTGSNAALPVGLFDTVESVCLDEEWALCRDHHIVQRIIPVVLGMERQRQLMGMEAGLPQATLMKALSYIYKCQQFQIELSSTAGTTCDQWKFDEPVQGLVTLKLGKGGAPTTLNEVLVAELEGEAPLTSLSYSINYTDKCTKVLNVIQANPRLVVQGLSWSLKTDPLMPGNGEIKDFTLAGEPATPNPLDFFHPGSTHQTQDICGDPIPPPETVPEFNWWSIFTVTLGDNPLYFDDVKGWRFRDWMVLNDGGPLLAKKLIDEKILDVDITYTSTATLLLTHKPAN